MALNTYIHTQQTPLVRRRRTLHFRISLRRVAVLLKLKASEIKRREGIERVELNGMGSGGRVDCSDQMCSIDRIRIVSPRVPAPAARTAQHRTALHCCTCRSSRPPLPSPLPSASVSASLWPRLRHAVCTALYCTLARRVHTG